MNMNMNMNMNDNDGKEIIYVYGVTVCWPTSKRQNVNVHIAYYILYIIYGRPLLAMASFAIWRSCFFYVLCVMCYKK
jgi:hypothetical protein